MRVTTSLNDGFRFYRFGGEFGRRGLRGIGVLMSVVSGGGALPAQWLAAQQAPPLPSSLAIRGVTVIDVTDGRRLTDQTVLVVGHRVQEVGPSPKVKIPAGAQVVDAQGKYLIPGLWDMHVHSDADKGGNDGYTDDPVLQDSVHRWLYPRYVANGVTGIREMGQRWLHGTDSFWTYRQAIKAGTLIGPRMWGPSADLHYQYMSPIDTPEEVRRAIDSLKAAGNVFLKWHGRAYPAPIFYAVMREARRVGLPVVGHPPAVAMNSPNRLDGADNVVTFPQAIDSGMRSIEHLSTHCNGLGETGSPGCHEDVQALIRNNAWLTPTIARGVKPPGSRAGADFDTMMEHLHRVYREGFRHFLAGTDIGAFHATRRRYMLMQPGLSLRQELVFLVMGGLTPLEALQAATLNPARFFEATDSMGTVAPGKLADLVLLDADPLVDITNVIKLWGVVANGRYYDHAFLERLAPESFQPEAGLLHSASVLEYLQRHPIGAPAP